MTHRKAKMRLLARANVIAKVLNNHEHSIWAMALQLPGLRPGAILQLPVVDCKNKPPMTDGPFQSCSACRTEHFLLGSHALSEDKC